MKKSKKTINIMLLLAATILVLYFMLRDNYDAIIHEIVNINLFYLIIALIFIFGYWFFKAIILYDVSKTFKEKYTFKKAFRIQLLTHFFNAITPFASGGQPFQLYSLKKDGFNYNDGTNIVMQEFIIYQLSLVTLGIIAIIYNAIFELFPEVKLLEYLVALGFLINFFVIVVLFILAYFKKVDQFLVKITINLLIKFHIVKKNKKEETLNKWDEHIERFNVGAHKLTENKLRFIKLYLLSLVALVLLYLIPCVLLYGMGDFTSVTPIKAIIASAYVMLIGSFVPIPGGTGGLEYGFIAFYGNFITGPVLSALMLIWRVVTYYFGLIIGAIMVNIRGKSIE